MTPRSEPLKNMGASVRARLTDKARSRGDDVQLFLLRFAIERLIYRLAQRKSLAHRRQSSWTLPLPGARPDPPSVIQPFSRTV
jgi:hypothetical protein